MSALSDVENLRLHDISDGDVRDDPRWLALMGESAVKAFLADMARKHLPGQHSQDSHGNEHGAGSGGGRGRGGKNPLDKLNLASRIDLNPGETLRSSGFVKLRDSYNGNAVAMAHIDTPNGRQVRLGLVDQGDLRQWRGRNRGATVQLDEQGIADLQAGVAGLPGKVKRARAESGELLERRWENEDPADIALFNEKTGGVWDEGVLASGPWGDLIWRTMPELEEAETARDVTATVELHVRPPNAPDDWAPDIYQDGIVLQERDVPKLQAKLAELLDAPPPKSAPAGRFKHLPGRHPQESHGNDHGVDVIPGDKLKLAGRIPLADGERLVATDKVVGDGRAYVAVTEKDGVRSVRLGLGSGGFGTRDDEVGPWRAGPDSTAEANKERAARLEQRERLEDEINRLSDDPDADPAEVARLGAQYDELSESGVYEVAASGYTAKLDQPAAEQLRAVLTQALAEGVRLRKLHGGDLQDRIDKIERQRDKLRGMTRKWTDEEDALWDRLTAEVEPLEAELENVPDVPRPAQGFWTLASGSIPGEWADVHYEMYLDEPDLEDPAGGARFELGAIPHGSDLTLDDLSRNEQTAFLRSAEARKLAKLLESSGDLPKSSRRDTQNKHLPRQVRRGGRMRRKETAANPAVVAVIRDLRALRRRLSGALRDELDGILAALTRIAANRPAKHGNHDQSSHGRRRSGVLGSVMDDLASLREKLSDDDRSVLDKAMAKLRNLESSDVDDDDLIEDEPDEEDGDEDEDDEEEEIAVGEYLTVDSSQYNDFTLHLGDDREVSFDYDGTGFSMPVDEAVDVRDMLRRSLRTGSRDAEHRDSTANFELTMQPVASGEVDTLTGRAGTDYEGMEIQLEPPYSGHLGDVAELLSSLNDIVDLAEREGMLPNAAGKSASKGASMATKSFNPTIKAVGNSGEGTATIKIASFGEVDKDGDVTVPGFFGEQYVQFVPTHNWDHVWLGKGKVYEKADGAYCDVKFNLKIGAARDWYEAIKFDFENPPSLAEYSYGYNVLPGGSKSGQHQGRQVRFLQPRDDGSPGVEVFEVGSVMKGAGTDTGTVSVKGRSMRNTRTGSTGSSASRAVKGPIPVHETKTVSRAWDRVRTENALPDDARPSELRTVYAWVDPDGDPELKASYSWPHHHGIGGPANLRACLMGIAALNGSAGADMGDAERKGIYDHLAGHLKDADRDIPDLRTGPGDNSKSRFSDEAATVLASVSGLIDRASEVMALRQRKGKGMAGSTADLLGWVSDEMVRLKHLLANPVEPEAPQPSEEEIHSLMVASMARIRGIAPGA